MENQYDTVVLRKNKAQMRRYNAKKTLIEGKVVAQPKFNAANNKKTTDIDQRKLDENNDGGKHKKISFKVSNLILQSRVALKLNRKDLANKLNVKESIVVEYETGKAIPNNRLLQKMEKILKTKLCGVN